MIAIRESARRCPAKCRRIRIGISHDSTTRPAAAARLPRDDARRRHYYTNADRMKKSDPYAALGLSWGATASDIKEAYRRLARELHPDVSRLEPAAALNEFRAVKEAYDKLMNHKNNAGAHRTDLWEEWSFAVWRGGDLIAQERTDVAGTMRKRPVKPAESLKRRWGAASLGHPDGRGVAGRGEYLAEGPARRSSTVGTGRSKWVERKEYRPWNPEEGSSKRGSRSRKNDMNAARKDTPGEDPIS